MTPNRVWEAGDPAGVEAILRQWFEDPDEDVQGIAATEPTPIENTIRVGWLVHISDADGPHVFEQQAYVRERDARIDWMRVMCSGWIPLTSRPRSRSPARRAVDLLRYLPFRYLGILGPGHRSACTRSHGGRLGSHRPHVWRISAVVILGAIMSVLDTTIVNVALDTLAQTCTRSIAQIQWVVTGYLLALAAVIPVTGWAARRFGAKRVYMLSLVLFTVGSVLCGLARRPSR